MDILAAGCALTLCSSLSCTPAPAMAPANASLPVQADLAVTRYYAYMDFDTASEALKPKIQEARNRIIFSSGWVTEGTTGYITDGHGNILEEVPQFYDLFPADWEVPVFPTDVK